MNFPTKGRSRDGCLFSPWERTQCYDLGRLKLPERNIFLPGWDPGQDPWREWDYIVYSPGKSSFYEATFPDSVRFPIHPTIWRFLNFYNICSPNFLPMRGDVSSAYWWYGDSTGVICPLANLGVFTPYSKVQSQTRGGITLMQERDQGGPLVMSKEGRRDYSSYRETTGSSFRAWSLVMELHESQDHRAPQVNLTSILCHFIPKYHSSPLCNKCSSFF